jgi:acetyl esterase/lipase
MNKNINPRHMMLKSLFTHFLIVLIIFASAPQSSFAKDNSRYADATHTFDVVRDIEWAKPKGFSLKMDIYVPKTGKKSYPVIIVYHGGEWLLSPKEIMNDMSEYLAGHSEFIVCNVQYRLLGDNANTTTMNEVVGDVFGAVVWVRENIKAYKGDPSKIVVTGDSAGGHLAEMVVISGNNVGSEGFSKNSLSFIPTYLPKGKTAEDIKKKNGLSVQAAMISYGVFDLYNAALTGFEASSNRLWEYAHAKPRGMFGDSVNVKDNPEYYKAISPIYNIPKASERKLPRQFVMVGTKDRLVTAAQEYVKALKDAGQPVEYWEFEGRPHGFLDRGVNHNAGTTFVKDGIPAVDKMIGFLNGVFK